jgi:S1-C subfamily serine protease
MTVPTSLRRGLAVLVVLLGGAALGFSQGASNTNTGHPSDPGVLVLKVQSGSPAETAGIVRGDIITDINGTAVNSPRDVRQAIASHKQGDSLTVKVRHGDQEKSLSVALGQRNGRPYLGVLLFPDVEGRLGMRAERDREGPWMFTEGALVARVASGGPADKAGIRRGDVILSVDGTTVDADHSLSSLIKSRKSGDTVTLSVRSFSAPSGKARDVSVTLGSAPDRKTAWLGVEYRQPSPTAFMPWGSFPPAADFMPWGDIAPFDGGPQPHAPPLPGHRAPRQPVL